MSYRWVSCFCKRVTLYVLKVGKLLLYKAHPLCPTGGLAAFVQSSPSLSYRWPAQVLDPEDPWIPPNSEAPRHGAIPVRFFGTYDFAWIENQRAVCQYDANYEEHSSKSKQKVPPSYKHTDTTHSFDSPWHYSPIPDYHAPNPTEYRIYVYIRTSCIASYLSR
jgi:hypothetical protein